MLEDPGRGGKTKITLRFRGAGLKALYLFMYTKKGDSL
jgi:hypothetical protein